MSYSQQSGYFLNAVLAAVKDIVDRSPVSQNQLLYQTLLTNLHAPNSSVQNSLWNFLDQKIGQNWRNGVHQQTLEPLLREWLVRIILPQIENYLMQQQQQMSYTQQPGGGYGMPQVSYNTSPTSGIYGVGGTTPQQPAYQPPQVPNSPIIIPNSIQNVPSNIGFDLGREVMFELTRVNSIEIPKVEGGIINIDGSYRIGEFEKERVSTIDISLTLAQNDAISAGKIVYDLAPQEVIRGIFANVVKYNELFHIPIGYKQFLEITATINDAYINKERSDWRTAIEALSRLTRSEWRIMDKALTCLLNKLYYRRLRTTSGAVIEGIDSLDDLTELDDRNSKLKVTKHTNYWSVFNTLTTLAIESVLDTKGLIHPGDKNFGDFINCSSVIFYSGGRSKYDYGTFQERIDTVKFIEQMMMNNIVIRVPRAIIVTNAIDSKLVSHIKSGTGSGGVLFKSINSIGTSLIEKIEYPKRDTIEGILCLEKGVSPNQYLERINLGRTLDQDFILIR